jgi:hypothetical protein
MAKLEIGNESGENLHPKAIGASDNQGIDVPVLFPPAKEFSIFQRSLYNRAMSAAFRSWRSVATQNGLELTHVCEHSCRVCHKLSGYYISA